MKKTIVLMSLFILFSFNIFAQDICLPSKINLFKYSESTNPKGILYGFPAFRLFGWSKDGKLAYSVETNINGRGGIVIEYLIQDLVTDTILWKLEDDSYLWEEDYEGDDLEQNFAKISFNREKDKILTIFNKYSIIQTSSDYKKLPIISDGKNYTCSTIIKDNQKDEFGFRNIDYKIVVHSSNKEKVISEHKNVRADNIYVCGWFISPFEKRVAVIYAEEKYVFEGYELFYKIAGCSLETGF